MQKKKDVASERVLEGAGWRNRGRRVKRGRRVEREKGGGGRDRERKKEGRREGVRHLSLRPIECHPLAL